MTIEQLGYVVIRTPDQGAWDKFLLDIVGAMPGRHPEDGARHYRIDDRSFRFRIEQGEQDRLVAAAYRVSSAAELDALRQRIEAFGRACEVGTPKAAKVRGVDRFFATTDPTGNGLEFYCGDSIDDTPFVSAQGVSGFVTGDMGLGHAVFAAPDFETSHKFYRDVVGFNDTDLPHFKMSDDPEDNGFRLAFMHADNGRHHSVALGEHPPTPVGCVHLMVELKAIDDVGRVHDRMRAAGIHESASIGRHANDQAFSFYMRTPSGFDLEVGADPLVVDPKTWKTTSINKISDWGHVWSWQR